jgi:hypothetical protein
MTIKISQLPSTSVLADANLFPLVANVSSTLTSQQATLAVLKNYVLAGTAATATKLVTSRTINGVAFDGTSDINISVSINNLVHAFSVDTNGDLLYYQITDTNVNLQNANNEDLYATVDVGTDRYTYGLNNLGMLVATFN